MRRQQTATTNPETARTRINEKEAVRFFAERDAFLIYTHNGPDADTLGSAAALVLGLRQIGKEAYAFNREGILKNLAFLNDGHPFVESLSSLPEKEYVRVSVDIASMKMVSEEDRIPFELSIDHHMICTVACEKLLLRPRDPAAGQIVFDLLKKLGVKFDKTISTALYAAISSDSGGFRYDSTNPKTMRMAAMLMESGIDFAKINRQLFDTRSIARVKLESLAGGKVELYANGQVALICLSKRDMDSCGATAYDAVGLNDIARRIEGVEISAVIRPEKGHYKCSFRSNDFADVGALAFSLGGGGHKHASSFMNRHLSLKGMKELVLSSAEACLKESKKS